MRRRTATQVYLPLVLCFWLFGSLGSFVLGEELHAMPQALSSVSSSFSQGIGGLLAALGVGDVAQAAPSEAGPKTTTTPQPTSPTLHTTSATTSPPKPPTNPLRATPPAPPKAGPGAGDHSGPGNKGPKGNKGKGGGHDSGNSDD